MTWTKTRHRPRLRATCVILAVLVCGLLAGCASGDTATPTSAATLVQVAVAGDTGALATSRVDPAPAGATQARQRTATPTPRPALAATATRRATAAATPTRRPRPSATPTRNSPQTIDGLPVIHVGKLPPEALDTLRLIAPNGPFPYAKDGVVFQNREGILPRRSNGYYHEYTVITPGENDRGARRIVTGANDEFYYTDDHYDSFKRIVN